MWSFFLFLLFPVELRGLLGALGAMGQGRVLLPWLLKPEVAVEEGEKPPLTAAKKKKEKKPCERADTAKEQGHHPL